MLESVLYNPLCKTMLKWLEEIERDYNNLLGEDPQTIIESTTDQPTQDLLMKMHIATEEKMGYICNEMTMRALHLGVKIGLDLQKTFDFLEELI